MSNTLYVTPAQVLAAQLAIELSEEAGEEPDKALTAIANARVEADEQSAPDSQGAETAEPPTEPEEAGRPMLALSNETEHALHNWYISFDRDDAPFDVLLVPRESHPLIESLWRTLWAFRRPREGHESSASSHEAVASKRVQPDDVGIAGPARQVLQIGGPAAVDIHVPGSGVWQVKVQELAKALREAEESPTAVESPGLPD